MKLFNRVVCFIITSVILLSTFSFSLPLLISADNIKYQIGYTFDNQSVPGEDISGIKNLPDNNTYSITDGYNGTKGNSAKFTVDSSLLSGQNHYSVAFNVQLKYTGSLFSNIFYVAGENSSQFFYIESFYYTNQFYLTAFYKSGSTFFTLPLSVPKNIKEDTWLLCVVVFGEDALGKYFSWCCNGEYSDKKYINSLPGEMNITSITFDCGTYDNVYFTNQFLSDYDISVLCKNSLSAFMKYKDPSWAPKSGDNPGIIIPEDPVIPPDDPENPISPINPEDTRNPDRVVKPISDFTWMAYTFDNTFDLSSTLNGAIKADISSLNSLAVNTSSINGSFGRGLARRWSSYPDRVISLNEGLLYQGSSFTLAAWIYYEDKLEPKEVSQIEEVEQKDGSITQKTVYYNKQIPSLTGTIVSEIFDLDGNNINFADCFSYNKDGTVKKLTTVFAYDSDGRVLDLSKGKRIASSGRYYVYGDGRIIGFSDGIDYTSAVVWEDIPKADKNSVTSSLFKFEGKGLLKFSPFTFDSAGNFSSTFSYGNDRNNPIDKSVSAGTFKKNKWIHYAITFDRSGVAKIYVNGELKDTVTTGLKISDLKLTNLDLLTGCSENEFGRFIIDEVYFSSKILSASEIRKLEYYGIEKYSSEALVDPGSQGSSPEQHGETEIDEAEQLENQYVEYASIENFIGTTFDDSKLLGRDYNGSVTAAIRNASLKQGFKTYGLAFNGLSSYMRYPIGILDDVPELTISIAYNWNGVKSGTGNQRLFDFAKKESYSDLPIKYICAKMGDGESGLEIELSDGVNTTTFNSGINIVNKWVRLTVIVSSNKVSLYFDNTFMGETKTNVDISSICPNFNYIGKSNVKGDALFSGTVDEIYISSKKIDESEIKRLVEEGIVHTDIQNEDNPKETGDDDLWDKIIDGILIIAAVLSGIIIIAIIVAMFTK